MLCTLEQSTGAELNIVANNEANLEIILRVRAKDLGLSVRRLSLLELEDPVQFPGTLLEQARGDDETIELIIFIFIGIGFRLGCGCTVRRSGAVVETKI